MEQKAKKFLIIDSNSLVHRAYHAIPPLKTKSGQLVNAVFGFCSMFLRAVKETKPDYVIACFDVKGPTFRHERFVEYKAKRKKAPDELYQQIDEVKKVLEVFRAPVFGKQGFEGDDLIATITKKVLKKQILPKPEIVILSGDLDNLQLVNAQVKVFTLRKGFSDTALYDIEKVKEKYNGLLPEQLVDLRGLRGDASDNIPGVTGIGEKTAIGLLKTFGSLENLYKEIEKKTEKIKKLKPGVLQKLIDYKEQALFSKQLAKMDDAVDIDFNLKESEFNKYDINEVVKVFMGYEFFSLLKRLAELNGETIISSKNRGRPRADPGQTQKQGDLFGITSRADAKENIFEEIDKLEAQGVLTKELARLEKDLAPIIQEMENWGIKVDEKSLGGLSQKLAGDLQVLEKQIYQKAGSRFNINSSQQLSEILFEKLKISIEGLKKTPGGVVSTGALELEKIKGKHPLVGLILDYRELFKLKTGFVDSLPKFVETKTSRIHPHFHQLGTETGRMSCSEPNLQNIPVKGQWGKEIRQCFVAEAGFEFLSVDYKQMELRVVAKLAKDKKMLSFFQQGKDIHTMTASEIFEKAEDKISKEQRELAKTLNFGVLYGMGPRKFSQNTGLDFADSKKFIAKYFAEFTGIALFIRETLEKAKKEGFSETYFGRKRFLPEIESRDPRMKAQAERIARNLPGQGTAADIMKMAMAGIKKYGILSENCRLVLQIHDELLMEIKKTEIPKLSLQIKSIMEKAGDNYFPLTVEIKTGKNWGALSNFSN